MRVYREMSKLVKKERLSQMIHSRKKKENKDNNPEKDRNVSLRAYKQCCAKTGCMQTQFNQQQDHSPMALWRERKRERERPFHIAVIFKPRLRQYQQRPDPGIFPPLYQHE